MKFERYKVLSGVVTLIVLIISTVIFTILRPEYDHLNQSFSELGELYSPYYFWFNLVTFGIVGVLAIIFTKSLKEYWGDKMDKWLYTVHYLGPVSWIMTGIFPVSFEISWLYDVHLAWAFMTYLFGTLTITLSVKLFNQFGKFIFFSLVSIWLLFGVWAAILLSYSVITPYWGQLISIASYFSWQAIYSILVFRDIHDANKEM